MFILGSVLTNLILAVSLIMAAAVAGLMAYHYAKARLRENQGFVYDPDTDTVEPDHAGMQQRAKSAEEIAQIRARIEALMEQQQMASETQNQHLGQKLDEIRTHMGQQDVKMDGLKSELRHEIRSRDSELGELRQQLAAALDSFWKAMPAIAEGGSNAMALPPAEETQDQTSVIESFETPSDEYSETDLEPTVLTPQPENEAETTFSDHFVEEATATYDDPQDADSYSAPEEELQLFDPTEPAAEEIELMPEFEVPALSPVEPEPLTPIEPVQDFNAWEPEEEAFSPVEPEPSPVEPEPVAFTPIEPAQEFEAWKPEETVSSPAESEPVRFSPAEPVQEFETEVPQETAYSPVEPEPVAFAPIELAREFEIQEPEEATSTPIETAREFEAPEAQEATISPLETGYSPFTPIESAEEIDVPEPEDARFAPFESEPAAFAPIEPEEATITPIAQESDPDSVAATFEPISFSSEAKRLEDERPAERESYSPPPPHTPSEESFEAPIFEPIEFAKSWAPTDSETEQPQTLPDPPVDTPALTPVDPVASAFAAELPSAQDTATPNEPFAEAHVEEPFSDESENSSSFIQPEAPDAEPDSPEEAIWTSAAAWTEPTPYDSVAEDELANEEQYEVNVEGQPAAEDPGPTEPDSPFVQHVVVSPSGDSISVEPKADAVIDPPAPAEAPKAVLDADSLFTGDPRFDPPSPFDESDDAPVFDMEKEDTPAFEVEDETHQLTEVEPEPAPESKPANEDRPPVAPESSSSRADAEGDDLTVISSITPEVHDQLYELGITTLDEMARWSRADARRVSTQVGVSEETIMHQWIFEAQSVLFDSFQDKIARQTARQAR